MKHSAKRPPRRAACILESAGFSKVVGKKAAQYTVNDKCIGCGTCVSVCPRHNIRLEGGRPVFGGDCIGCLSCIQYCPAEALNVGKVTEKRERYHNPNGLRPGPLRGAHPHRLTPRRREKPPPQRRGLFISPAGGHRGPSPVRIKEEASWWKNCPYPSRRR